MDYEYIIFFTYDAGLLLGVLMIFGYLILHGVTATVTMILNHYSPIMKATFIISIILALVIGLIESSNIKKNYNQKYPHNRFGTAETISLFFTIPIYNILTVPPVMLFLMQGILNTIRTWFSEWTGLFVFMIFAFVIFIIYAIVLFLILLIGLGIPTLIKYIFAEGGILGNIIIIVIGVGIAALFCYILKQVPAYPFVKELIYSK